MRPVLMAIAAHPRLKLQIVATGMHLDRQRGRSLASIEADRWKLDATVPWTGSALAAATGSAIEKLSRTLARLNTDIVLVVGDRVEAFAGAVAGCLDGRLIAHVHGGDRALGQVDDSLRHAVSKLAHLHFPATRQSAARLLKLGEDPWRIHHVGSPGIDGIVRAAASRTELAKQFPLLISRKYALLVLHPVDSDEGLEHRRAKDLLAGTLAAGLEQVVIIYPNNDPGSPGIIRAWKEAAGDKRCVIRPNVERNIFLGLLRDAHVIVGNSSSGIIEAASFGTPAINVGPRQLGRECSPTVRHFSYNRSAMRLAVAQARHGRTNANIYGSGSTGRKIAIILGRLTLDDRLRRKLITY
jgi:GDP/UDP-N,N'-diacetylbacillosamine 2-epimerase (hydrolysing)